MNQAVLEPTLVRAIGVRALAANVVNQIIGASIFVLPAVVAAELGTSAILAYFVCAAAIGLVALCFAEAGSRVSLTGGTYAYMEAAFGPYIGFLGGTLFWLFSEMLGSAAVAVVLVGSLAAMVPAFDGALPRSALLVLIYVALAAVNIRGVRTGVRLVEVLTVAKLAPLALLVIAAFFAARPENLAWTHAPSVADVGRAALVVVFAFSGMEGALTPSGEVSNPSRTVPRGLLLGVGAAVAVYVAVQLAAQGILGPELAASQKAPLARAAERAFGGPGRGLILFGAIVSSLGFLSGNMLAASRLPFAFARGGFLPSALGSVHARFRTPYLGIVLHALLACGFALTGSFRALAVLSATATLLIYLACCVATLVLRRRDVRADGEPFQLRGGPVIPVLACMVVLWLLTQSSRASWIAVAEVCGVASLLYLFRRSPAESAAVPPSTPSSFSGA
jgi:amino acid transporter